MSSGSRIVQSAPEELKRYLSNLWWRLDNLYWITNEKGEKVKFKLRPVQRELMEGLWYKSLILKARQLGFTTAIQIFLLDRIVWNDNVRCGVIAHNRDDAGVFFRDKIKFAYDNLPEWIRSAVPAVKDDAGELLLANNSSVRVGTSLRSGTFQYLHISEHGKICRFPEKAKEVRTGALNTVQGDQFVIIESTAEGTQGDFARMAKEAEDMQIAGKTLTKLDYKFFFFPWWKDPKYQLDPSQVVLTPDFIRYFSHLELEHGIKLTGSQMAWYVKKAKEQGDEMKREFPSTPKEAFEQSIEGAYFATEMAMIRKLGRLSEVPWEPMFPVNTFWDLGMNDDMAIWFHQRIGSQNRLIDFYKNSGEGFRHYANVLKEKGYSYGNHYMPHDVNVREIGYDGKSRKQIAESLGIRPIIRVPRPKNLDEVIEGIDATRAFLGNCFIDETMCGGDKGGIEALDNYRKEWDENLQTYKKGPLHNWASHPVDALRTGATGFRDVNGLSLSDALPEPEPDY